MKKNVIISVITPLVIIFDYITKQLIVKNIMLHESINVLPCLRIVHYENRGAAFGMFRGLGNSTFIIISMIAILCILLYFMKVQKRAELYALSLILGGAAGNLIDRIRIGQVVDFIDIYVGKWHWPAFNIADSALTAGIILFVFANIRAGTQESK